MNERIAITAVLAAIAAGTFVVGATWADSPPKSQWNGVYTEAQAHRGEQTYGDYCEICHGPDLMGGEMAPPLIGGPFQANWNEQSLGDLFERIRISMPLNAPGSLNRQQYADVLAYLLSKDRYPAGKTELPTQTDVLNNTKYLANKP
jgi:mono/diheme cytochrome c family protein